MVIGLTLVSGGISGQRAADVRLAAGNLRHGMRLARTGRTDGQVHHREFAIRRARNGAEIDRQNVRDRCAGVATFGKGARAADHQQSAAAALDELGDHPQLIARERGRFDVAQDQAAILEQLFAGLRESAEQMLGIVDADAR